MEWPSEWRCSTRCYRLAEKEASLSREGVKRAVRSASPFPLGGYLKVPSGESGGLTPLARGLGDVPPRGQPP